MISWSQNELLPKLEHFCLLCWDDQLPWGCRELCWIYHNALHPIIPHHTTAYHTIPHHTTPHHTTPHHTISHHTMPHYPYHTTPHHTTLHYTAPHHTTLDYTTPHHSTLHYTTPHHNILCYTTLHYTTLHYTTLHNLQFWRISYCLSFCSHCPLNPRSLPCLLCYLLFSSSIIQARCLPANL